jgi:hypothetical protein
MTSEAIELRTRAETFRSLAISYEMHVRAMNSPVAQAAYEQVLAAVMEAENALMATADMLDEQLALPFERMVVPVPIVDMAAVESF